MVKPWKHRRSGCIALLFYLFYLPHLSLSCPEMQNERLSRVDKELMDYLDNTFAVDKYRIIPGVKIEPARRSNKTERVDRDSSCERARRSRGLEDYFYDKFRKYYETHLVSVNLPETARFFFPGESQKPDAGKSSFMAGFSMGFLAFALKKLLLPVFIGAQLVKSVLIAMFLPSIIGSLGKLLGKGLSSFSGLSGASAGGHNNQIEDFEFKDTSPYNNEGDPDTYPPSDNSASGTSLDNTNTATTSPNSRFGFENKRVSYVSNQFSNNYYLRQPNKKADYKVFHKIPSSSMLLTTYDPFYSPLLSRLDAVFLQLGLGDGKAPGTEACRERLVCLMYANPAKYAPYSNLVSAQLSRELNELRKPATDNPEILRFFRYMKAAKDGQDGEECAAHTGCPKLTSNQPSPALLTTFNEINKLVQARQMH